MQVDSTGVNDSFDRVVAAFSRERPRYEKLANYVCGLIRDHCGGGLIHTTEQRAKSVDSFDKKCRKLNGDGELRYERPLEQITDLAGVRVIVFLRDSVDIVCDEIANLFNVVESEDVGERVYLKGKFGYQSKHLLVSLNNDRKNLIENSTISELVCEIQVRTLLQHAWAEMEHDIQYKSKIDVPLDLNKRFSALAGLLEIADREFASIQRDSETLKRTVKEDLVSDLTQQGLSQHVDSTTLSDENAPWAARDLVSSGRYDEAIKIYTEKISKEPDSHTLYMGRARALFLTGNVRDALTDLDKADELSQGAAKTTRLREIIEKGDDPGSAIRLIKAAPPRFVDERRAAEEAIRAGDGVKAFTQYTEMEALGYNRAFAIIGKAASCILERDVVGARNFIESLQLRPGTPMAVNILALECMTCTLENNADPDYTKLDQALAESPNFNLKLSPLNDLKTGLKAKGMLKESFLQAIFERLPTSK